MKRPTTIQQDFDQIRTIESLTSIFQSIASIHIAQIKDRVVSSTQFFNELWAIYRQLRADAGETPRLSIQRNHRLALVVITSESGLIGDIDERIIQAMLQHPMDSSADLYMIGTHGAKLLAQRGIKPLQVLAAPDLERGENVRSLAKLLGPYDRATVYYQTYISLAHQDVARIDLFSVVQALGAESLGSEEVIASTTYVLEPSGKAIIRFMESVMIEIALSQVVLESRLAQYASRFNTMHSAKTRAKELQDDLGLELQRTKRAASDERTKEVLSGMKALRHQGTR